MSSAILGGVVITTAGADTVNGTRNLTATGLFGHNTTRTWNGSGNGTHGAFWVDSAASRTADVSYSSIFTNVVVALPRSANPYPVSGTISRAVTGTGVVTKGDSIADHFNFAVRRDHVQWNGVRADDRWESELYVGSGDRKGD